jgi:hypothetical protein
MDRWAGHAALIGRGVEHTGFWRGNVREGDHLEDACIEGRIILKWVLETWDGSWTGSIWLRIGQVAGCCEGGNGNSSYIKCREFVDYLRTCYRLRKGSASWN